MNRPRKASGKDALAYAAIVAFSILFLVVGNRIAADSLSLFGADDGAVVATIDEIVSVRASEVDPNTPIPEETLRVVFTATIRQGARAGEQVTGVQTADSFTPTEIRRAARGDRVLLYEMDEADPATQERWVLQEFVRTDVIRWLLLLFVAALLVFGRRKGFNTVLSLAFTCAAIFAVFIPAVLSGRNLYAASMTVCAYIVIMTLLMVNGPNRKSLAAGVGCLGGIFIGGLLVVIANHFMQLTGMVDEQSVYLLYLNPDAPINLRGVIFSSIIIGASGATLDVAVSIAASLAEVRDVMRRPTRTALFNSGMNIGRDIMGTMANTLVLAYIGSSMSLVLLLLVSSSSLLDMLNREIIVVEMLRGLSGSVGLLCTIPLTSFVCAYVYTFDRPEGAKNAGEI